MREKEFEGGDDRDFFADKIEDVADVGTQLRTECRLIKEHVVRAEFEIEQSINPRDFDGNAAAGDHGHDTLEIKCAPGGSAEPKEPSGSVANMMRSDLAGLIVPNSPTSCFAREHWLRCNGVSGRRISSPSRARSCTQVLLRRGRSHPATGRIAGPSPRRTARNKLRSCWRFPAGHELPDSSGRTRAEQTRMVC